MTNGGGSFPRGFLLTSTPVEPPAGFLPGPVLPNFYVHPWAAVESATDRDGWFVVVVGTCVSTVTEADVAPADVLLGALRQGEGQMLEALSRYAGRHAVFYGSEDGVCVVADATAMRSLFYAADTSVLASHALLVERALGGPVVTDDLPFKYGFPGNHTPYRRTRLLTPNTLLDLQQRRVRRFWPITAPPELSVEEAARAALDGAATALRNIAADRPVRMGMTAGLDSRAMLAVALRAGIEFETYTYGIGNDTLMDRNFAADLTAMFGVPHTKLPRARITQQLVAELSEAHYAAHHRAAVASLSEWIEDRSSVAVTANLLEIGRGYYQKRRTNESAQPTTASGMAKLYYLGAEGQPKVEMKAMGRERYLELAADAFQDFIDATDFDATVGLIDPFDQFYWEHRMCAWHGTSMVERDFYAEAFIPFNSRSVFEAMLGAPRADRDSAAVLKHLIREVDPRLLELPINPPEWPPPGQ